MADIIYDPGKQVAGVLFNLSEAELRVLDEKVGRHADTRGRETGAYRRVEVKVNRLGRPPGAVTALAYQTILNDGSHVPPTQHYMDVVVQGCFRHGISTMWIAYLKSFSTHVGRGPRPPGLGDAESRL